MMRKLAEQTRSLLKNAVMAIGLVAALAIATGCGSTETKKEEKANDFFTSGNPEADQRARKTVKAAQEDSGGRKKESASASTAKQGTVTNEANATLYDRLGREHGITAIVDDFTKRVLEDPRVNWSRKGVTTGHWWKLTRPKSVTWNPTPENVAKLKTHMVQFLSLAAGGPVKYDGREIKIVHADMQITKPEFDAAIGDLKASLDKLQVTAEVQKDLLAIVESTRPLIVPDR